MPTARRAVPPDPFSGPGLYLHVPFCSAVCPYCDFAVQTGGPRRKAGYVASLLAEIALVAAEPGWRFDTVYLGGGTPSILPPEVLAEILAELARRLDLAAEAWIFLEANPEDVDRERLAAWRRLGVATLSLGVQSFADDALRFLGRRHDARQSRRCVELAREAGFHSVSVDLIYGLPGQRAADWRRQLEAAVALAPDHLSCYQLTVHEGTRFGKLAAAGELDEIPEALQGELFALTHALLADRGYEGYEVSNFSHGAGHRSRHNVKYWDHTPYLGLGPSAHSFTGLPPVGGGRPRRFWNERRLTVYNERLAGGRLPRSGGEELSAAELAAERLMLGLRTRAGVDLGELRERYGAGLDAGGRRILERLLAERLVELDGERLAPTTSGLAVADALARDLSLEV